VNVTLNLHTHPLFSAHHASDAFQKKLESILKRQKQEEEEDPGITTTLALACLDHISSLPSITMPLDRLVPLCRAFGFEKVFVDGAHAPGVIDLVVPNIGADFYAANLHISGCLHPQRARFCKRTAHALPSSNC
jgi:selenocysteine lyase/cysteine desulfurase